MLNPFFTFLSLSLSAFCPKRDCFWPIVEITGISTELKFIGAEVSTAKIVIDAIPCKKQLDGLKTTTSQSFAVNAVGHQRANAQDSGTITYVNIYSSRQLECVEFAAVRCIVYGQFGVAG